MSTPISFHDNIFEAIERHLGALILTTLARFTFLAALFFYYWNSAQTKIEPDLFGWLLLTDSAYVQMFPKAMEAAGYSSANLPPVYWIIALTGTWAEFILPALIVAGLATRLAALGMIGFVIVQSYVDIFGHGLAESDIGAWLDTQPGALIMDQRAFWIFVLITLVVKGGGPLSLDGILRWIRS